MTGKETVKTSVNTSIDKKYCSACKNNLDIENFYKTKYTKDGLTYQCKKCISDVRKRIRKEKRLGIYVSICRKPRLTDADRLQRKIEAKEYHRNYRIKNADVILKKKRDYTLRIKNEGIDKYGGKCDCCGESIREFLTIEHKNGRNKNNKRLTGRKMWAKAKAEGYPSKYTVLCFNCNCAKGAFGFCPHELKEKE